MNRTVAFGAMMGTAAIGVAIGYLSGQSRPTVACSPAPLYQHVKEAEPVPAKDMVQQEAPAKAPQMMNFYPKEIPTTSVTATVTAQIARGNANPLDQIMGTVVQSHGRNCAWIHRTTYGQWVAESLVHWGNMEAFKGGTTYEQAVQATRERWCK